MPEHSLTPQIILPYHGIYALKAEAVSQITEPAYRLTAKTAAGKGLHDSYAYFSRAAVSRIEIQICDFVAAVLLFNNKYSPFI